jgi:hypothetical protein
MAVQATQLAVGTAPVKLSADGAGDGSSVLVQAPAGAILYLGGADVNATTKGFPVAAGGQLSVDLPSFEELYGVLASGTGTVTVLRVGA